MKNNQRDHRTQAGKGKGEPSVRIVAPTAFDALQLQEYLCRWWNDRKELWDDYDNRLGRGDPSGG